MLRLRKILLALLLQWLVLFGLSAQTEMSGVSAQTGMAVLNLPSIDLSKDTTLYTVGYSHLDTEWRWDYQTTIRKYVKSTMSDNFALFEKYPHYVFNFSGANRYRMMKEYYPQEYQRVKEFVAGNRWFPCGSSMEENDALIPSSESIIRQILYGNGYFKRELGKASNEYMLPDCFGFPASLPSILAHCGIRGFSTQKLSWGSAVGIPFNIGSWIGPDGESVVSVLNPGSYGTQVKEDLSSSPKWLERISDLGKRAGIVADYMYYGTGDMGGAPAEESVQWIEKSITSGRPIRPLSASADRFFRDLSDEQKSKLPTFSGELLLTNHSAGSISSQAYMKRWNRKNELLAYSAEASSVIGDWLGGITYPQGRINEAWRLVLGGQFHDIMAGTCIPKAYEYSWNDEVLAANQFSGMLSDAVGAVARALDTQVKGVPLVVFNSLPIEREDVVDATVVFPRSTPGAVRVFDSKRGEVPSQITKADGNSVTILFLARVPSLGFATYDVRPSEVPCRIETGLKISNSSLENSRYVVKVNSNGDIESILDKSTNQELLSAPARLAFLYEHPQQWPAWNMDWNDRKNPPVGYVEGPASVRIIESGPARLSLEIERESRSSRFVQRIRLSAGASADRVEVDSNIDWFTKESSLKATFPLTVCNPSATYNTGMGTVTRGNNDPKKFEVPSHQWFDLTDSSGAYGVSILEDCKYGSDKPGDKVLRLTLLYTPGVRNDYKDQASQDFGRHEIRYALFGHKGDWREGNSPWQAARLNQPLMAFQATPHKGFLGKSFSFLQLNSLDIAIRAIKKTENGDEVIIRLQETKGTSSRDVRLTMAKPIVSAREVNGQEEPIVSLKKVKGQREPIGSAAALRNGALVFDTKPYHPRTFALRLAPPSKKLSPPKCQLVQLSYDTDVVSTNDNRSDGNFGLSGNSFPAEMLSDTIVSDGIIFRIGSKKDGDKNALVCRGQSISLPEGKFDRIYFLAASAEGDTSVEGDALWEGAPVARQTRGTFKVDGKPHEVNVPQWDGFIGQWDNRKWSGYEPKEWDYAWDDIFYTGLTPGYVRKGDVACFTTHRHLKNGEDIPYSYAYLYKCKIAVPGGAKELTLPVNNRIHILAVSVANNQNDATTPASVLFDTLNGNKTDYERFQVCAPPKIIPESYIIEEGKSVKISFVSEDSDADIRYTLDGSAPTMDSPLYAEPLYVDKDTTVKAIALAKHKHESVISAAHYYTAYLVKGIQYLSAYSPEYPGGGDNALIDSRRGSASFMSKAWQGFEGNDLEAILDLGEKKKISQVTLGCMSANVSWIFLPTAIEVAVSDDGKQFRPAASQTYGIPDENQETAIRDLPVTLKEADARYIRVKARNVGILPAWHRGSGGKAWLFVDEIIVE
jgi:alpha-mannosidase